MASKEKQKKIDAAFKAIPIKTNTAADPDKFKGFDGILKDKTFKQDFINIGKLNELINILPKQNISVKISPVSKSSVTVSAEKKNDDFHSGRRTEIDGGFYYGKVTTNIDATILSTIGDNTRALGKWNISGAPPTIKIYLVQRDPLPAGPRSWTAAAALEAEEFLRIRRQSTHRQSLNFKITTSEKVTKGFYTVTSGSAYGKNKKKIYPASDWTFLPSPNNLAQYNIFDPTGDQFLLQLGAKDPSVDASKVYVGIMPTGSTNNAKQRAAIRNSNSNKWIITAV